MYMACKYDIEYLCDNNRLWFESANFIPIDIYDFLHVPPKQKGILYQLEASFSVLNYIKVSKTSLYIHLIRNEYM